MSLVIAVDFDGTIACHGNYPKVGSEIPSANYYLRRFKKAGASMFLWTCRDGHALELALDYLKARDLEFDGINDYRYWDGFETSRKLFANVYIDDAAAGVPLVHPQTAGRPYVDWEIIGPQVLQRIIMGQMRVQ